MTVESRTTWTSPTSSSSQMLSAGIGRRARWAFTDRTGGTSGAPYDSLNLGGHVGDDSTAVLANRGVLAGALGVLVD